MDPNYNGNFFHYARQLQLVDALGDVYVDLSVANTPEEKFMVTYNLLKKHNMLPTELKSYKQMCNPDTALTLRSEGNEFFNDREFDMAIECYTKSMIQCVPGSLFYAYAVANRSAALYHVGCFDGCLIDIQRAIECNYPIETVYKLFERAGNAQYKLGHAFLAKTMYYKCVKYLAFANTSDEKKMKFQNKIMETIEKCTDIVEPLPINQQIPVVKLLEGKHENIPAFSKSLELKYSENMGRGVFTNCDINPGDVVAIDEPYVCGTFPNVSCICQYYDCKKKSMSVIPCPKCLLVFYCDEECMQKDSENYTHNMECPILYSISIMPGIKLVNELVIKYFFKGISKLGLEKYCSEVKSFSASYIDPIKRGFDENGQYKSDNFMTSYTLDVSAKVSMDTLFFFNCVAVEMIEYLILSGFKIPQNDLATIGGSLVQIMKMLDSNCWKSNSNAPYTLTSDNVPLALSLALYPTLSLFNHSCDPNVMRCGRLNDRTRVLKAIQPIPKGSQLFISYYCVMYTFLSYTKEARKMIFKDIFKFKCLCQACVESWPTSRYIPKRLSHLNILNFNMMDIVLSECNKFIDFKNKTSPQDHEQHLDYLYYFIKFLFNNVKRPFALYEDCLKMISYAHVKEYKYTND